jgi:hypothetical protein
VAMLVCLQRLLHGSCGCYVPQLNKPSQLLGVFFEC